MASFLRFEHAGQAFTSLSEVVAWLKSISSPEERFLAQENVARSLYGEVTRHAETLENFMSYVENDTPAYRSVLPSYREFEARFRDELEFVRHYRRQRNRRNEAVRTIRQVWARQPEALAWFEALPERPRTSKTFLEGLRTLAKMLWSWDEVRRGINCAIQARLDKGGRGIRLERHVTTSDLTVARLGKYKGRKLKVGREVGEGWLGEHGMRMGPGGIIQAIETAQNRAEEEQSEGMFVEEGEGIENTMLDGEGAPRHGDIGTPPLDPGTIDPRLSQPDPANRPAESPSQGSEPFSTPNTQPSVDSGDESGSRFEAESEVSSSYSSGDEPATGAMTMNTGRKMKTAVTAEGWKRCGCSGDVTDAWASNIDGRPGSPHSTLEEQFDLLAGYTSFRLPCYMHSAQLARQLGVITTGVEFSALKQRLERLYDNRQLFYEMRRKKAMIRWLRPDHVYDLLFK